jgi:AraC family transcriptional activator of mtrCDE
MLRRLRWLTLGEVRLDLPSRLLEMMSGRGRVDVRRSYGAPWRIEQRPRELNEIPSHAVLAGSRSP